MAVLLIITKYDLQGGQFYVKNTYLRCMPFPGHIHGYGRQQECLGSRRRWESCPIWSGVERSFYQFSLLVDPVRGGQHGWWSSWRLFSGREAFGPLRDQLLLPVLSACGIPFEISQQRPGVGTLACFETSVARRRWRCCGLFEGHPGGRCWTLLV